MYGHEKQRRRRRRKKKRKRKRKRAEQERVVQDRTGKNCTRQNRT